MRRLFVFSVVVLVTGPSVAEECTVGTFNAELLNMRKLHIKYGLPFDIEDADLPIVTQWNSIPFRTQRFEIAVDAVAEAIQDIDVSVLVLTKVGDDDDLELLVNRLSDLGAGFPTLRFVNAQTPEPASMSLSFGATISQVQNECKHALS